MMTLKPLAALLAGLTLASALPSVVAAMPATGEGVAQPTRSMDPSIAGPALAAAPTTAAVDAGYMHWYNAPGGRLACGGRFNGSRFAIAHRYLPCGTKVLVVTAYGRVEAVVDDRGPWCRNQLAGAWRGVPWAVVAHWPCSIVADATPAVRNAVMAGRGHVPVQIVVESLPTSTVARAN